MAINFEIYDCNGNLIGKDTRPDLYTYNYYKNSIPLENKKIYFDFHPTDENYKSGRFDFHEKDIKIEESEDLSFVKITVSKYELLKKDPNLNDYSTEWESFPK